ncbi:hypothetical protein cyc_01160 [Cyclospora cayetanensis]|uniref:Uncharacterized protein n=1 Tax=Cyclospora cayetanensis TaxID=88456 RepID=A0A1D3DA00_9EIME|nr:hypothetical protein cyc_01160 [Cyclospora cayetanensis]
MAQEAVKDKDGQIQDLRKQCDSLQNRLEEQHKAKEESRQQLTGATETKQQMHRLQQVATAAADPQLARVSRQRDALEAAKEQLQAHAEVEELRAMLQAAHQGNTKLLQHQQQLQQQQQEDAAKLNEALTQLHQQEAQTRRAQQKAQRLQQQLDLQQQDVQQLQQISAQFDAYTRELQLQLQQSQLQQSQLQQSQLKQPQSSTFPFSQQAAFQNDLAVISDTQAQTEASDLRRQLRRVEHEKAVETADAQGMREQLLAEKAEEATRRMQVLQQKAKAAQLDQHMLEQRVEAAEAAREVAQQQQAVAAAEAQLKQQQLEHEAQLKQQQDKQQIASLKTALQATEHSLARANDTVAVLQQREAALQQQQHQTSEESAPVSRMQQKQQQKQLETLQELLQQSNEAKKKQMENLLQQQRELLQLREQLRVSAQQQEAMAVNEERLIATCDATFAQQKEQEQQLQQLQQTCTELQKQLSKATTRDEHLLGASHRAALQQEVLHQAAKEIADTDYQALRSRYEALQKDAETQQQELQQTKQLTQQLERDARAASARSQQSETALKAEVSELEQTRQALQEKGELERKLESLTDEDQLRRSLYHQQQRERETRTEQLQEQLQQVQQQAATAKAALQRSEQLQLADRRKEQQQQQRIAALERMVERATEATEQQHWQARMHQQELQRQLDKVKVLQQQLQQAQEAREKQEQQLAALQNSANRSERETAAALQEAEREQRQLAELTRQLQEEVNQRAQQLQQVTQERTLLEHAAADLKEQLAAQIAETDQLQREAATHHQRIASLEQALQQQQAVEAALQELQQQHDETLKDLKLSDTLQQLKLQAQDTEEQLVAVGDLTAERMQNLNTENRRLQLQKASAEASAQAALRDARAAAELQQQVRDLTAAQHLQQAQQEELQKDVDCYRALSRQLKAEAAALVKRVAAVEWEEQQQRQLLLHDPEAAHVNTRQKLRYVDILQAELQQEKQRSLSLEKQALSLRVQVSLLAPLRRLIPSSSKPSALPLSQNEARGTRRMSSSSFRLLQHSYCFVMQQLLSLISLLQDACGEKVVFRLLDVLPRQKRLSWSEDAVASGSYSVASDATHTATTPQLAGASPSQDTLQQHGALPGGPLTMSQLVPYSPAAATKLPPGEDAIEAVSALKQLLRQRLLQQPHKPVSILQQRATQTAGSSNYGSVLDGEDASYLSDLSVQSADDAKQ